MSAELHVPTLQKRQSKASEMLVLFGSSEITCWQKRYSSDREYFKMRKLDQANRERTSFTSFIHRSKYFWLIAHAHTYTPRAMTLTYFLTFFFSSTQVAKEVPLFQQQHTRYVFYIMKGTTLSYALCMLVMLLLDHMEQPRPPLSPVNQQPPSRNFNTVE